ncbi:hypothetical protein [Thermosulfurimonas dismutans]|nr:hypothetical protein [Thermosulfurimonas dismutans]
MKRSVFVGLLLCLLLPGLGWGDSFRINLWPLLFYAKEKERSRLELLGPFIYRYRNTKEDSFSLRPIFTEVTNKEEKTEDLYFLSPLGHYHKEKDFRRFRLVPLFSYDWVEGEKTSGAHHTYFPVFWGRTESGEKYWGLFPIYGRMKERFGYDEIRFVLWPIYSQAREGSNRSTNILWPIFNYSRGPELSGFKVWPIWGYRERKGQFRRSFFLWPFFISEERYYDDGPPARKRMFFPLWVREEGPRYRKTIYFWPFFQHLETTDQRFKQWDLPWPIFQIQKGEDKEGFRIFPLFGYRKTSDKESNFVLWPIFQGEHLVRGKEEETSARILLLSRYRKVYREGEEKESFIRFWPLFVRYRSSEGESLFYFPAILPFYDEGVERNWGPFLKLLEYYRFPDGKRYFKLLWGLYRYEAGPSKSVQEIAFLLSLRRSPSEFEFSLFHGLFAIGKEGGRFRLKVFWYPLF